MIIPGTIFAPERRQGAHAPATVVAPPARPRVPIYGVGIDPLREHEVNEHITTAAAAGRGGMVLTPNVDLLRQAHAGDARRHFDAAELIVADGMPLIWASRLAGTPLPERVAGSDLIWTLSAAAARTNLRVFLLGGNPGAADAAAERLVDAAPGLCIAGTHFPPYGFERDPAAMEDIVAALELARPDIVFVGLPFPKQAELSERLRTQFGSAWFICVGVSLSFVAGEIRRAPQWMRRTGIEWLWRLTQEPKRLAKRYLADGLPFAARLLVWGLLTRRRARHEHG